MDLVRTHLAVPDDAVARELEAGDPKVSYLHSICFRLGRSELHANTERESPADRAIFLRVEPDVRVVELVRVREIDGVGRENDVRRHTVLNAGVELIVAVHELRHAG